MIALAPWKDSMVSIDVRQAAIVAISKGWCAELALAAGSYLSKITLRVADDATVP